MNWQQRRRRFALHHKNVFLFQKATKIIIITVVVVVLRASIPSSNFLQLTCSSSSMYIHHWRFRANHASINLQLIVICKAQKLLQETRRKKTAWCTIQELQFAIFSPCISAFYNRKRKKCYWTLLFSHLQNGSSFFKGETSLVARRRRLLAAAKTFFVQKFFWESYHVANWSYLFPISCAKVNSWALSCTQFLGLCGLMMG